MFGKIKYINNNIANIENINNEFGKNADLMNLHVIFEEANQKIVGEIEEIDSEIIKIKFLGEIINNRYIPGVLRKPLMSSQIRLINQQELTEIIGSDNPRTLLLGSSPIYNGFPICVDVNQFFSNHLAIFGNTGSGKSCGVARIIQNIFLNKDMFSYNANLFIFDAYGEYRYAFSKISEINQHYNYKFITTNPTEEGDSLLKIPLFLLNLEDMALLLQVSEHGQLPIVERTIKLTKIFSQNDAVANRLKNHLIAKAILSVLFSNQTTASKKNEVFRIIEACSTPEFNFNTDIQGLGYTRKFSECFEIDSNGNFGESVLINDYILSHLNAELEATPEPQNAFYNLTDFQKALDFTLISEGFQNNSNLYDDAIILKVRLASIMNSKVYKYFDFDKYLTIDEYINLLVAKNSKKSQIININLEDVDDVYAKVIVKIFAHLFFEFAKGRTKRASIPFHLILEEAHRYVQKDSDTYLLGYNIFDRIAKEGRKYGVVLDIISQRPVELSDTVISQMSNFLIFKMTHPLDLEYIKKMLPNISSEVIEKQKSLQPGTCVAFGTAFKIPMIIKFELPNPMPYSTNCDVLNIWNVNNRTEGSTQTTQTATPNAN